MALFKYKDPSTANKERGVELLRSVKIMTNVIFALLIFQTFLILPRPGDPELERQSLLDLFAEHTNQLLVILVGIVLVLIYWGQVNLLSGNLKRSSPTHAILCLVQVILLMLYLYFLRFDIEYDGMTLALQMESILLALAGFVGAFSWYYAKSMKLTTESIDNKEYKDILFRILPEPIASAFTLPFAVYGPGIWTLSFLSIIPIGMILRHYRKRAEKKN